MNKYPDIVMLALPRWDGAFSSTSYSLAKEMAKNTRVFYVDNPYTWKDVIFGMQDSSILRRVPALFFGLRSVRSIPGESLNLVAVTPLVILPINFLPRGFLYELLNKFNNWIVRGSIKRALKHYNVKRFIFINSYNPFYLLDTNKLSPLLSVYHCVDNISESKYVNKHGAYLEERIIQKYDLTLVTSRKLLEYASKFGKLAYLLPNAVDFKLFSPKETDKPFDFPESKSKVIGYIGSIDHRIDYDLLEKIATHFSNYILLLVGPVSKELGDSGIASMPNVFFTGSRKINELPAYLSRMDCAIIPFKCNELTSCIYPLKLNEYLAAGKPVVSTSFSIDLVDFKDLIYITDPGGFINGISEMIQQVGLEEVSKRQEAASRNTWADRAEKFWEIVLKK